MLQIFLYLNLVIIGAILVIAIQHALAHYRPAGVGKAKHPDSQPDHLPPKLRQELLEEAQADFHSVIKKSSDQLQKNLLNTSSQLTKDFEKLGKSILDSEKKRYQSELDDFRKRAGGTISSSHADIAQYEADLKKKLADEIAAEKQMLVAQIDTKLSDAVLSFLVETMQHDVDLGAQTTYLTKLLEEHKVDFINEVGNETKAT